MPNRMSDAQRRLSEIETGRYSAVRAAGWAFDHAASVWRHEHTGRTGLNQHVIYECLRNHDAMPPCGQRRDETPRAAIREWVVRGTRLREIEATTGRLAPQYGQPPRSLHVQITPDESNFVVPAGSRTARARASYLTEQPSARPQAACGKVTDAYWQA